ncbi:MAG: hypothetical protein ACNYZG_13170, partial [Gammaproteobacteria bacterium]
MNTLDTLLIVSLLTAVVSFVLGNRSVAGWSVTVLYAVQLVLLLLMAGLAYGTVSTIESTLT